MPGREVNGCRSCHQAPKSKKVVTEEEIEVTAQWNLHPTLGLGLVCPPHPLQSVAFTYSGHIRDPWALADTQRTPAY